jgi:hypothetical protein
MNWPIENVSEVVYLPVCCLNGSLTNNALTRGALNSMSRIDGVIPFNKCNYSYEMAVVVS